MSTQLTKYTHSCVRFADGDRALVIDPGSFSEVDDALDGVDAVLITHEHADHVDVDKLRAALAANSALHVWAPSGVATLLGDLGSALTVVAPGQDVEAGGFRVSVFGGQHAVIHPSIPVIDNVGYLIEGVYHPGDSFAVPTAPVETLLLPIAAPWSKASEVIDFAVSVRAPRVHQIHEAVVSPPYVGMVGGHVERIAGPFGVTFEPLTTGQTVDV